MRRDIRGALCGVALLSAVIAGPAVVPVPDAAVEAKPTEAFALAFEAYDPFH